MFLYMYISKIKIFAEGLVGCEDPRGMGYTTQPSANTLMFIIALSPVSISLNTWFSLMKTLRNDICHNYWQLHGNDKIL